MSNSRNLAKLKVDANGDVASDSLDNVVGLPDAIDVNASAPADSLAISSAGNVGVGTSSPTAPLDIARGGGVSAYTSYRGNNVSNTGEFYVGHGTSAEAYLFNRSNKELIFGTNNSERMRIDSSGNVGVGVSPNNRFSVGGSSAATVADFRNTKSANGDFAYITIGPASGGGALFGQTGHATTTSQFAWIGNAGDDVVGGTGLHIYRGTAELRHRNLPAYFARAWVNFDGTGTVAIRSSGNVSSITDNGTGSYNVNFTNAMPDSNYSAVLSFSNSGTMGQIAATIAITGPNANSNNYSTANYTTSSFRFISTGSNSVGVDPNICNVAVFR